VRKKKGKERKGNSLGETGFESQLCLKRGEKGEREKGGVAPTLQKKKKKREGERGEGHQDVKLLT